MASAAVIKRVGAVAEGFKEAAPGHRFNMYFPIWRENWSLDSNGKKEAIQACTSIPTKVGELLDRLRTRQLELFDCIAEGLRVEATSTAPFATGLGIEHPVENGFSFLTPYGLPYLAGSGVKGVFRRAAEELALFSEEYNIAVDERPTMLDVWWLFGFEGAGSIWSVDRFQADLRNMVNRPDFRHLICRAIPEGKERQSFLEDPKRFLERLDSLRQRIQMRGALAFWDVFPKPKNVLTVEIMTPHYGDYYQAKRSRAYPNGAPPHNAGQPNPIPFLAVPAGSSFVFHVVCESQYLPDMLRSHWKALLERIVNHAFDWLGFGAKTSVGYGVMQPVKSAANARTNQGEAFKHSKPTAKSPEEAAIEALRKILEIARKAGNKEPGGELNSRCMGLLREARNWESRELRRKASDLIEEAFKWLGWPGNKEKVAEKRKQIDELRNE